MARNGGPLVELIAAITGNGDTTYNNAADLLNDYFPEDVLVYVPSYITSDGLRVAVQWLKDAEIELERVKRHLLTSFLAGNPESKNKVLIVLGISGSEEIIQECMEENIPVLDLSRGLYRVSAEEASYPEMPLDGSVSDSETITEDEGTSVYPPKDLSLESLSEPQPNRDYYQEQIDFLKKEVERLHARVKTMESGWEPISQHPVIQEQINEEADADRTDTVRYYQNGKGKIRKAGRSRIKSGEKEVWLTETEVESLTS